MPVTLTIQPWSDPVIDTIGHDPRSRYVETFWLPTLGPTAVLLLRHLADRFDTNPKGVELTVADTSQQLGLGQRDGNSSPILRTLTRLQQFDLACDDGRGTHAVRRLLPPVNPRHVRRLPAEMQREHARWVEERQDESPLAEARRRSRRVAFTLLEQGDEPDHVERVLNSMGFHPAICHESARWANSRHREALEHATAALTEAS